MGESKMSFYLVDGSATKKKMKILRREGKDGTLSLVHIKVRMSAGVLISHQDTQRKSLSYG